MIKQDGGKEQRDSEIGKKRNGAEDIKDVKSELECTIRADL